MGHATWIGSIRATHHLAGIAWDRLKITRDGSHIAIYINGQLQATVSDSVLLGRRLIGLVASSPVSNPMDARFDDFALYPASCGPIAADMQGIEWGETEFMMGSPRLNKKTWSKPLPF